MFNRFINRIKLFRMISKGKNEINEEDYINTPISKNIHRNLEGIKKTFKGSMDINIRPFEIGKERISAFIVNIEGMIDRNVVDESVLGALMKHSENSIASEGIDTDTLLHTMLNANNVKRAVSLEEAVDAVLCGDTVLFIDRDDRALVIQTGKWEHRQVKEPQTENTVRGPHEGFTETLRVNTILVRRKIKDANLKFEGMRIGRRTKTDICVVYIDGLANEKIVDEVKTRLNSIDIDGILESGYIEELIRDAPLSPFPTVGNVETPDKLAAKLLEGRVAIMIDGTPMTLTVPYIFAEAIQYNEDYYFSPLLAFNLRVLRYLALNMAVFLTPLYIALSGFHPSVIPQRLLLTMIGTRETTPFPASIEAFLMVVIFELLREAGIRMPRSIGQALSIVGALIMGQVAVNAGLVGSLLIIVVALSGIMNFLLPALSDSITILRVPVLIMTTLFGMFGLVWSYMFILIHMITLRSFGAPYLSPVAPFSFQGLKDFIIRVPWSMMKKRPEIINWDKSQRQSNGGRKKPKAGNK